jgi:GntR family transcriptional regulator, rspAB operon transcriptional repressor
MSKRASGKMTEKISTGEMPLRPEPNAEIDFSRHVDRKLPAADQIYQGLREAIISGGFRPNEAISENRVCGMFNVSRSPVRIALTRLAEDKLIDIFPQRGSFVSPIILQKVQEGHFARMALELAVLSEAAKQWTEKASFEARNAIKLQQQFSKSGDSWSFHTADELFHRNFAQTAKLEGIWDTILSVKTHLDRVRHLANPVKGHMEKVIAEHKAVVQHLDSGDAAGAVEAMRKHLDSLHSTIARLKSLHSTDFIE